MMFRTLKMVLFPAVATALLAGCQTPPVADSQECDVNLPPLCYWDSGHQRYWYLAGLGGYWRCDDYHVNHWTLPFYLKNRSGCFSLPYSRIDREGLTTKLYLGGLGGHASTPDHDLCSWIFPFYYHDRGGLWTLLYGKTASCGWVTPFCFRDETDFQTLVWSVRDDARSGERGFFSLPLLSAAFWNTNTCERSWYALLGLAGSKTNASDTHREFWTFPFYGRRRYRSLARDAMRLDAQTLLAAFDGEPDRIFSSADEMSVLMTDWDLSVRGARGTRGCATNSYVMTSRQKKGNRLLFNRDVCREVAFGLADGNRVSDVERQTDQMLGSVLYRGETTLDHTAQRFLSRHRVLWKLWDWKRQEDYVSLDILFIPVWR